MYRGDNWERFERGTPPASSADWGWVQHMVASLKTNGRMAVVLDTGAVARGSGNQGTNRERDIRKAFIDDDLVEAVILLPENLFYNTSAPGIIMLLNRAKRHPEEVLLVNGSTLFTKARPKNFLAEEHIAQVAELYTNWQSVEGLATVVSSGQVAQNDWNLSPNRYVATAAGNKALSLDEAVRLLREAEEQRAKTDEDLWKVLAELGVG
jgi:type I restriction enzyme M protein